MAVRYAKVESVNWYSYFELQNQFNLLCTVAHNCHIKYKFSHQKQIPHIKNKFLTSKSNLPHQTQIRHSKSKIVTAKTIFATSKTKLSHQKQICHSKNKFLTSKANLLHQNPKHRLNGQRSMNESYLQFSLGLHPTAILFLHMVQYVVLGPRIKIIILNILPHKLKFSLKITFMVLAIISKWQAPNGNIFLVIQKKVTLVRECGPWSSNHTSSTNSPNNFRTMMRILTIFYLFFIILDISKLQSCWKSF